MESMGRNLESPDCSLKTHWLLFCFRLFEAAILGNKIPQAFNNAFGIWLIRKLGWDRATGCSKLNSGLFGKMKAAKNILATFCGHE